MTKENNLQDTASLCENYPSLESIHHILTSVPTKDVIDEDEVTREYTEELIDQLNFPAVEEVKSSYESLSEVGLCSTKLEMPASGLEDQLCTPAISEDEVTLPMVDLDTELQTKEHDIVRAAATNGLCLTKLEMPASGLEDQQCTLAISEEELSLPMVDLDSFPHEKITRGSTELQTNEHDSARAASTNGYVKLLFHLHDQLSPLDHCAHVSDSNSAHPGTNTL